MKTFKHETIIVKKDGWKFLRNLDRVSRGFTALSNDSLDKIWDRTTVKNGGANPKEYPINDDEIRIDPDMFGIPWDDVKKSCYLNDLEWRRDGFLLEGINI